MSSFLQWYSQNNTMIIQILFGVTGVFICVQVFRLFFSAKNADDSGYGSSSTSGAASGSVEEKLNKIIENQNKNFSASATKQPGEVTPQLVSESETLSAAATVAAASHTQAINSQTATAASVVTGSGASVSVEQTAPSSKNNTANTSVDAASTPVTGTPAAPPESTAETSSAGHTWSAHAIEIEKLKNEITQLQKTVQEKEEMISQGGNQQKKSGSGDTDSAALISQYKKEIEDLKSKLSDFDVIAADIAELPRLRDELRRYQQQVSAVTEDSTSTPTLDGGALDSVLADISQGLVEATENATESVTENSADSATEDVKESANTSALASEPVKEQEKELIKEFEKNKG